MIKKIPLYIFFVLFNGFFFAAIKACANPDTIRVYMKTIVVNNMAGSEATDAKHAEFIRMLSAPDTTIDKTLYPVVDFYLDGKIKRRGSLDGRFANSNLKGSCIEYYHNGSKKQISNYNNGKPVGAELKYFPNDKPYTTGEYLDDIFRLAECRDSTGKVLAHEGNGIWIKYNEDFKDILAQGAVKDGVEDGVWKGKLNDSVTYVINFDKGKIISAMSHDKADNYYPFTVKEEIPKFKGDTAAFRIFIQKHFKYPEAARKYGIQGFVIIQFLVDKDGFLTNFKIVRSADNYLSTEALRILKLSPRWNPGKQFGFPVGMACTVPINFSLFH